MEAIDHICKVNNATYDFRDEDFEIMKKAANRKIT